jgi:hypothetical protein
MILIFIYFRICFRKKKNSNCTISRIKKKIFQLMQLKINKFIFKILQINKINSLKIIFIFVIDI